MFEHANEAEWSQPLPPSAAAELSNSCFTAVLGSSNLSDRSTLQGQIEGVKGLQIRCGRPGCALNRPT